MHLPGYLYDDYHDARSLEHTENTIILLQTEIFQTILKLVGTSERHLLVPSTVQFLSQLSAVQSAGKRKCAMLCRHLTGRRNLLPQ